MLAEIGRISISKRIQCKHFVQIYRHNFQPNSFEFVRIRSITSKCMLNQSMRSAGNLSADLIDVNILVGWPPTNLVLLRDVFALSCLLHDIDVALLSIPPTAGQFVAKLSAYTLICGRTNVMSPKFRGCLVSSVFSLSPQCNWQLNGGNYLRTRHVCTIRVKILSFLRQPSFRSNLSLWLWHSLQRTDSSVSICVSGKRRVANNDQQPLWQAMRWWWQRWPQERKKRFSACPPYINLYTAYAGHIYKMLLYDMEMCTDCDFGYKIYSLGRWINAKGCCWWLYFLSLSLKYDAAVSVLWVCRVHM